MLVEAHRAFLLLENGVSLADQGHCDASGEAPALLLDWIGHVAPVVHEVRAKMRADATEKARQQSHR